MYLCYYISQFLVWKLIQTKNVYRKSKQILHLINFPKNCALSEFFRGATTPSVSGPPHFQGLEIILSHTTFARTPWSSRRRDLYLTTHNTHNRQTLIDPARFAPAIPASERPQTRALDQEVTGIGRVWVDAEKCSTYRQATDGNTIRRMRIACWVTEVTKTRTICNIYSEWRHHDMLIIQLTLHSTRQHNLIFYS